MKVSLSDIHIGERHRKDLGDIDSLAESIANRGLLHPPVVTSDMELVCGYRRVMAMEQLGWEEIEVRVFDPDDLLLAERDENEDRKDFTPSEKVAIAKTIQDRIGNRQGQRTDQTTNNSQPVQNFVEVSPGRKTSEVAAERAGFKNPETYRQAAKVVDKGVPELIEAMDQEEVSVSAAATVATLPESVQKQVVAAGPEAIQQKAREIRESRSATASNGSSFPAPQPALIPTDDSPQTSLFPSPETDEDPDGDSLPDLDDSDDTDSTNFQCPNCEEEFDAEVWHCPGCDQHWLLDDAQCQSCRQFARDADGHVARIPSEDTEDEENREGEEPVVEDSSTSDSTDPDSVPLGFAKLWRDIDQFLRSLPRRGGITGLLRNRSSFDVSKTYSDLLSLRESVDRSIHELQDNYQWLNKA